MDYLKTSPSSPLKHVSSLFARHEFQGHAGNLPHIHAMLKVNWTKLTNDEKLFVNDCIRASVLDIVKVEETNRLIDEGLWKNKNEVYKLTSLATSILSHKYSPRCLVMIDENKFVC